ncbi:hypothetical protein L1987_04937 [Smallanthus sonchifolius]|uniref:Uncharacterized protein n=1 Tax=Smallanthus sonchifolius TaxID=185202 RepID=A0ACB9JTY6_9ASTR|nr:hypothetical protein L1987_04937 [Smallanthus sonchifolius]
MPPTATPSALFDGSKATTLCLFELLPKSPIEQFIQVPFIAMYKKERQSLFIDPKPQDDKDNQKKSDPKPTLRWHKRVRMMTKIQVLMEIRSMKKIISMRMEMMIILDRKDYESLKSHVVTFWKFMIPDQHDYNKIPLICYTSGIKVWASFRIVSHGCCSPIAVVDPCVSITIYSTAFSQCVMNFSIYWKPRDSCGL